MEKLKDSIESALINEFSLSRGFIEKVKGIFEVDGYNTKQVSNIIAQEIKDIAIEFAKWIADTKKHGFCKQLYEAMIINKCESVEELFNQFINDKYK